MSTLFRTKSIDALIAASEEPPDQAAEEDAGPVELDRAGIGIVIGSGIFTVTGTAAAGRKFD